METIDIRYCPLCGSRHIKEAFVCVDRYASGEAFHVRRCAGCGFLFTGDAPVEAEIGRYYESPDYISHTDTDRGAVNTVYHWVRSFMLHRKAELVRRLSGRTHGRLLDIGSGTGYFANTMTRRRWQTDTIEKNAAARAFARQKFGLDTWTEDTYATIADGTYDVITLWHVMEHIERINDLWDGLHRWLKDDGLLLVAVPNCGSYDAQHYMEDWAAYDVPRHLWHFTPDTMERFARKWGFRLTAVRPMPFDAFYVSMLTEQHLGHKLSFVRGMLTGTRALLASSLNKRKSSSLIYAFEKE